MSSYIPQIRELIIAPPDKAASYCKFLNSSVESQYHQNFGYLFGLIEYEGPIESIDDLLNQLLGELQNNFYYDNYEKDIDLEQRLEIALQKTNSNFLRILNASKVNIELEKLNLNIALVKDKDLFLITVGKIPALLAHKATDNEYKMIDIGESTSGDKAGNKIDPLKLFSQVISGSITTNDYLFLANTTVLDYLSLEKIKKIITLNKIDDAILELKKLLDEVNTDFSMGLVIISVEPALKDQPEIIIKQLEEFEYTKAASKDSMHELIRTQNATQKILNTSYLPDINKYRTVFKRSMQQYLNKVRSVPIPKIPSINKLTSMQKATQQIEEKQYRPTMQDRLSSIPNPLKSFRIFKSVRFKLPSIKFIKERTRQMTPKSRLLLFASIALIVIFGINVVYIGVKNKNETNAELVRETMLAVQEKNDEAKASLIYEDETKARKLLLEAKEILNELTSENKKEPAIQNLEQEIELQLSKLRHLVEINDPLMLANFENVNSAASVAPLIVLLENKIYSQDHNNQAIYKLDPDTKNITTIFQADVKIKNAISSRPFSSSKIIFLNENQTVFELNTNSDTISQLGLSINPGAEVNDFDVYNQRLYFIDKKNNQIYRYRELEEGFGSPTDWIKEKVDLSMVTSFAIDGQIFLLKENGQITMLLNGLKTDFEVSDIDPALQNPTKVKTFVDSDYLYILDPSSSRLVVIDKTGKLIIQYHSSSFDNLKDFAVDERNDKIYLLNGNMVFGISANHLE
ncbi:DUF5050 domain-containing protein [Patescibacteria group bacterium]|nr:DUF5050 domain-containing protein [Patescibacteria group bacterium]